MSAIRRSNGAVEDMQYESESAAESGATGGKSPSSKLEDPWRRVEKSVSVSEAECTN